MLTEAEVEAIKTIRCARKVWDGRGLYLLVTPKGGRRWRFAYRFVQKYKTLSLGTSPVVTLERARSRHEFARNLLAHGVDPAALKAELGKHAFAAMMREWGIAWAGKSAPLVLQSRRDRAEQVSHPMGEKEMLVQLLTDLEC